MSSPTTPREFISYAEKLFSEADLFYGHGTDNPYDEAVYLVLRGLGLAFNVPDDALDSELSENQRIDMEGLIRQRIDERIPVAYLVNEAWFAGLSFYVNRNVLIPRSPIAELIHDRFSPWLKENEVHKILELGTGSGCIAIACAKAFPNASVDAVDIDVSALKVAERNVDHYQMGNQITLKHSDLFNQLSDSDYDLVISNPPYVSNQELAELPPEYLHEPGLALRAGEDGLETVRRILTESPGYMSDNGVLIIEVGNSQDRLVKNFPDVPFTWLEFEHGGEGVFLLSAEQLRNL